MKFGSNLSWISGWSWVKFGLKFESSFSFNLDQIWVEFQVKFESKFRSNSGLSLGWIWVKLGLKFRSNSGLSLGRTWADFLWFVFRAEFYPKNIPNFSRFRNQKLFLLSKSDKTSKFDTKRDFILLTIEIFFLSFILIYDILNSTLSKEKARRFPDCHYKLRKKKEKFHFSPGYYPGMNLNKIAMENNKKIRPKNLSGIKRRVKPIVGGF